MSFAVGDIVDVEFYTGQPIFPGEPELPLITRGRIIKLCEVGLKKAGEPITSEPGALIDVNIDLDNKPLKKRHWRDEAVPLRHIRRIA